MSFTGGKQGEGPRKQITSHFTLLLCLYNFLLIFPKIIDELSVLFAADCYML